MKLTNACYEGDHTLCMGQRWEPAGWVKLGPCECACHDAVDELVVLDIEAAVLADQEGKG